MPSHTAYAAAEQTGAAAQCTSVTSALYRAALGAVNPGHYLAAFERFDTTGRVLPGWNPAAALCPLCWLVFRRLWRQALLLVSGALSGALLLWVAYQWLAVPLSMLAGVALAGLLMLCSGMGLYGDALMHAEVQRRIAQAVAAAPTMHEAMASLQRQAGSRRWLLWVAALGVGLALAAIGVWLAFAGHMAGKPVHGVVVVAPVSKPEPAPALPAASAPAEAWTAQAVDPAVDEVPAVDEPVQPPLSPAPVPEVPQAAAAPPLPASAPAGGHLPAKAVQRRLYINVGLFADPENARRAHARLRQAGLPSAVEPLVRADGSRLQRVRVGPFTSAAQANAAAARVRAQGLEAVATAQ